MKSSKWRKILLGDIIDSISIKHKFDKESLIFLNTSDVLDGKVLNKNYMKVKEMPGQAKKSIMKGDILFSEIRPKNKRFAYVDFNSDDYVVSTKLMVLRKKSNIIDNRYLYKYLTSDKMLNYLQMIAEGRSGTFPQITFNELKNLSLNLPSLEEQKAIAKILSDLDEKIEVNNKINKNLEEMAQAIFKQWFVDFEFPNEEGKPYKSSGGEMVESELGMIPKGWKICELNELSTLTMGLSPKSSSYNTEGTGTPLLNGAADFNNGLIKANKYTTQETRVCEKGDLVFCIRATIGNLTFSDNKYCLGRGVAALRAKREIFICLIYMNLLNSIEKLKSQATGSVILGLSKPDINNMKVLYPNLETLTKYSNAFFSLFNKKEEIIRENERIEKLRDTLLPKLMSGEIRVPLENNEN